MKWVAIPPLGDLPDPGFEPASPAYVSCIGRYSLPDEPCGKPLIILESSLICITETPSKMYGLVKMEILCTFHHVRCSSLEVALNWTSLSQNSNVDSITISVFDQ